MLKVTSIVNGYLEENCYIIQKGKNALIVDPGGEAEKIIKLIEKNNLDVIGILITHYHFDHIGSLDEIKNKYKEVTIFDYKSSDNNEIECFKFKKINNFGHTMDSCSFLFKSEKIMFSGDFIFYESIGKYEDENEMINSLKEFVKLNDDIKIYPGHGPSTSVRYEKKHNYFLRGI